MRRPRRQSPHAGIGTISVGTTSMQCVLTVGRLLVRRRLGHLRLSVIDSCTALRSYSWSHLSEGIFYFVCCGFLAPARCGRGKKIFRRKR